MNEEYAVIILNGKINNFSFYEDILRKSKCNIAADGGANLFFEYKKIRLDYIVGDLDSIKDNILSYYKNKCKIEVYPKEKDFTDSEIAIKKAFDLNFKKIKVIGFLGDRIDHILTNINLMNFAKNLKIDLTLVDEKNEIIFLESGKHNLKAKKGEIISFIPFNNVPKTITLKGFLYNLDKYELKNCTSILNSNIAINNEVFIEIENGNILMVRIKE